MKHQINRLAATISLQLPKEFTADDVALKLPGKVPLLSFVFVNAVLPLYRKMIVIVLKTVQPSQQWRTRFGDFRGQLARQLDSYAFDLRFLSKLYVELLVMQNKPHCTRVNPWRTPKIPSRCIACLVYPVCSCSFQSYMRVTERHTSPERDYVLPVLG